MAGFFIKHLILAALIAAIGIDAKPQADPVASLRGSKNIFTLGDDQDDATIIYNYEFSKTYDANDPESEVSFSFDYPSPFFIGFYVPKEKITKIIVVVEPNDGALAQVFLTKGGIEETSVALQIEAQDVTSISYRVIIYGVQ